MSCNGCRVLRKGCSESCILRPCLQWIECPESQGHATVFVAKFFGRAGLMSFISAVPENQRPALFQSLLFEACGRTVNPVNGAVGLLGTGNWHVCQMAVETVLRGGTLQPMSETHDSDDASETEEACTGMWKLQDPYPPRYESSKQKGFHEEVAKLEPAEYPTKVSGTKGVGMFNRSEKRRLMTPSINSEESGTTSFEFGDGDPKVLNLFV